MGGLFDKEPVVEGYIYQIRMIMIGLEGVGKTEIITSYLSTLPKERVEKMLVARQAYGGVSPYTADTIISGHNIQVFLQDTQSFDDPKMTGSYLNRQAAVFIVIDPANPDSMEIEKLSEMIDLSTYRGKNKNLQIKLLINNSAKVPQGTLNRIKTWATDNVVQIVLLVNPLSGQQIAQALNETMTEIVSLMNNGGYEMPLELAWAGKFEKFGIKAMRALPN